MTIRPVARKHFRLRAGAVSALAALSALALSACTRTTPPVAEASKNVLVVSGSAQAKLFIAENGRPQKCIVLASSGDLSFDRMTCRSLIRNSHFTPAKDASGQLIRRVIVRSVALGSPGAQAVKLDGKGLPEFIFLVSQLPDGRSSTATRVEVQVDELGAITNCHAAAAEKDVELADVACGSLSVVWKAMPEQDDRGAPFRYVREFQVELRHNGPQNSAI